MKKHQRDYFMRWFPILRPELMKLNSIDCDAIRTYIWNLSEIDRTWMGQIQTVSTELGYSLKRERPEERVLRPRKKAALSS
jgi:hypothetical protein